MLLCHVDPPIYFVLHFIDVTEQQKCLKKTFFTITYNFKILVRLVSVFLYVTIVQLVSYFIFFDLNNLLRCLRSFDIKRLSQVFNELSAICIYATLILE